MATPFALEVLTPEGEVFNDEVQRVSTRTSIGEIGILARHQPLLGMLDPTELKIWKGEGDGEIVRFAQSEGYIQITKDRVMILVEEAIDPAQLDTSELQERITRAENELSSAGEDSEKRRVAERDLNRAQQYLKIAQAGS